MLCVNEVEACALAGTETFEADAVLTLLHEKYPQTRLLLTAGSAGSYYLDAERRLFVPCEKVQAVWILQLPGTLTAAIFWRAFAAAVQ